MQKRFKTGLKLKITLALILVSGLTCLIIVLIWVSSSKKTHIENTFNHLISLRNIQSRSIENYFSNLRNTMDVMANNPTIIDAAKSFRAGWNNMDEQASTPLIEKYYLDWFSNHATYFPQEINKSDYVPQQNTTKVFQKNYILDNPHPPGQRHLMTERGDGNQYDQVHRRYHPMFKDIMEQFGFYDIFLIDHKTGDIVYSVFKENDFGTNLQHGPYQNSNLAALTKTLIDYIEKDTVVMADFKSYVPSYGAPASFFGKVLRDSTGVNGILIAQLSIDKINDIMTLERQWEKNGLGHTGELYLVGSDYLMRSDSRFVFEEKNVLLSQLRSIKTDSATIRNIDLYGTTILHQKIVTEAVEGALAGNTNHRKINDYRNIPVLSAFQPLNLTGLQWVLVAEIEEDEIMGSIRNFISMIILIILGIWIIIIFTAVYFSDLILKPISRFIQTAGKLSQGNLQARVQLNTADEFETMANVFNEMAMNIEAQQLRITIQKNRLKSAYEELKNTQTQMVINEKMATLGSLSAGIAHDLRNPINYISGSIQAFPHILENLNSFHQRLKEMESVSADQLEQLADEFQISKTYSILDNLLVNIKTGVDKSIEIINSLQTYSFSQDTKPVNFDLHTNLDATLVITNHMWKNAVEIKKEYGEIPPINGYPGKLNQVFGNLITNAVDAILSSEKENRQGIILIKTEYLSNEEMVQIKIADNGVGVPEDVKDKIFDLLYTTKAPGKGTGLGLHMSVTIIKEHHGHIALEKEAFQINGQMQNFTTFVITLPLLAE
ncbi:MAG: HAMP domain-containing histidine kinase [Cyclobacteriaceae bacterium]|nr:HAMP domain-containing histidine kinase [Cyclobacteriaceae bacterium]